MKVEDGKIRVPEVYTAVDCGFVVFLCDTGDLCFKKRLTRHTALIARCFSLLRTALVSFAITVVDVSDVVDCKPIDDVD